MSTNGNPPRKLDTLRALMAAGKWGRAISLASSWADLGEQRDAIRQAASALLSPSFYEGMGKDPQALAAAGIAALKARYGEPCPACGAWLKPAEVCEPCFEARGMGGGGHE